MATPPFLEHAGRWFRCSGIQEPSGGVARYYLADRGQNLPVSTEITGYAASTLVYLHALTGEPDYLDRALRAAKFLTGQAWDRERQTFPYECNGQRPLAYFFDCGIIARGLLAVWRAMGRDEFLEVARHCGHSMARDFCDGNGGFHPVLRLPEKEPLAREAQWSRAPGCYQLKAAMAWAELADTGADTYLRQHYERLLAHSLETHRAFLPGDADPLRVMDRLHAYCYFLEGMLPRAGEERCAEAIREGIRKVEGLLREIGPSFARSDVYAQLLRMRCLAAWNGVLPVDRPAAAWEAEQLRHFQMNEGDTRVAGSFSFGHKHGQTLPHANPVSAAFALQALTFWEQLDAGADAPPRHVLI